MTARLDLEGAIDALLGGGIVALPSDTVYGVGAAIAHPKAVARLFGLKGRPTNVALPVIIDDVATVERLAVTWSPRATRLANAFWPGALTIVVAADASLAGLVGAASAVGLRVPDDDTLRAIARAVGPIAFTSANRHGEPPCTNAAAVLDAFAGDDALDGVLDGGERSGAVSSVVDVTSEAWRVLRAGAIAADELAAVLGPA